MPVPIPVMKRATIICGTEYAVVCSVAPICTSSIYIQTYDCASTHNDKNHRDPHRKPPSRLFAENKGKDTSRKASKIVNRNNDTFKPRRRVIKRIQEILVTNNSSKYALVVAKQHESQLTCDGDGGSQLETPSVPVVFWCFEHVAKVSSELQEQESCESKTPRRQTADGPLL